MLTASPTASDFLLTAPFLGRCYQNYFSDEKNLNKMTQTLGKSTANVMLPAHAAVEVHWNFAFLSDSNKLEQLLASLTWSC